MAVITAEQFINKTEREMLIPGFDTLDEPICIKVRAINLLSLLNRKNVPNALMPAVEKLFKLGNSNKSIEQIEDVASENISELMELMIYVCEKIMVQPTYEEIGEYLTQEQLMTIFNSTQGTVNALIPSNNK